MGDVELTPVEREVLQEQIREQRCGACVHRRHEGSAWGVAVWGCRRGLEWPRHGRCHGFKLDGEA